MSLKRPGIYAILNLHDQRAYIGRSVSVGTRWVEHRSALRRGVHHCKSLQAAWQRLPEAWFAFVMLEHVEPADAPVFERFYLSSTPDYYNESSDTLTGPKPGRVMPEDQRQKISARLKGKPKSAAHRERISASLRGVPKPWQSKRLKGSKLSAETRAKMATAHKGLKPSLETRAKRSASLKGRVFTDEWKMKIAHAKRGKPWSVARRMASVTH